MMKNKRFRRFYLCVCLGVLLVSFYPLYMGIRTVGIMLQNGAVPIEDYPKYVVPYTPIALALITGVLMLPVFSRLCKRFDFPAAAIFCAQTTR